MQSRKDRSQKSSVIDTFISSAAPKLVAVIQDNYFEVIEAVLANANAIVLGAWEDSIFQNNPKP